MESSLKNFRFYAFLNLGFLLFVICFGAYVRMTGSGAGCGSHWPLCNGVVIPREPLWQTVIEFSHRLTSGVLLLLGLALCFKAYKTFSKGATPRTLSFVYLGFLFLEALLGAFLVKFEHVAENRSIYRGFSVSVHLVNTFILVLTASGILFFLGRTRLRGEAQPLIKKFALAFGFFLIVLVGLSGAITALGDTLFPVDSMWEAFVRTGNTTEHLFVRLRVFHPFLAIFSAFYLIGVCFYGKIESIPETVFWSYFTVGAFCCQLLLGYLNVLFHAPYMLQLSHLLMALVGLIFYSGFCGVLFYERNERA